MRQKIYVDSLVVTFLASLRGTNPQAFLAFIYSPGKPMNITFSDITSTSFVVQWMMLSGIL